MTTSDDARTAFVVALIEVMRAHGVRWELEFDDVIQESIVTGVESTAEPRWSMPASVLVYRTDPATVAAARAKVEGESGGA